MYEGFLSLGGIEIGNADRVQSYARNRRLFALRQDPLHDNLHVALEEEPYTSPLLDDAPWVDERDPSTHKFLGILPVSIKGISDSTRTAEVTESIVEGGTVNDGRAGTREMRYTGMIVAEDDLGAESGMAWLRKVAEGDQCGMHGQCGTSDLTFFLDKPDVCASLYVDRIDFGNMLNVDLGALTPGADLVYRYSATRDLDQPLRGLWGINVNERDGVEVSWGLLDIDSGDVVEEIDRPLLLRRTNLLSNPSFTQGLNGVSVTAGSAALSRQATGGVDDGAHARLTPTDGTTVRTNWVPDPAFTISDVPAWRTSGSIALLGGIATFASAGAPLYAEFTAQGPVRESNAPVASTFTASLRVDVATEFEIAVYDNLGTQTSVARTSVPTGGIYRRSVAITVGKGYVVRLTPLTPTTFTVNAPLLEEGAGIPNSFFSGSTSNAGQTAFYLDGTAYSASRIIVGTRTASTLEVSPVVGVYGPMVASLAVRSRESAEITASMISTDDGTVLATRTFVGGEVWDRIPLVTQFGRSVRLRIVAKGRVEIDQMLVENASVVYDYFDGDSKPPAERPDLLNLTASLGLRNDYGVFWTGAPGASPSRTVWQNGAHFAHDDSRVRPFIRAVQGRLASVGLGTAILTEVTMDEQLDPYERTFHDVSVIEGPIEIERMRVSGGVVVRFSMLIVAANPGMFGRRVAASLPSNRWWTGGSAFVQSPTTARNYATNPINTGSTFPSVATGITARTVVDPGLRIPGLAGIGTRRREIAKGTSATTDDSQGWYFPTPAGSPHTHVSVWVMSPRERTLQLVVSFAQQNGDNGVGSASAKVKPYTWTKLTVLDLPSDNTIGVGVTLRGSNADQVAGDVYSYTAMMVTRGVFPTTPPDFFSGDTPSTTNHLYTWAGTAGGSESVRTERTRATTADLADPTLPALPVAPKPPLVGTTFPAAQLWRRSVAEIPSDVVEAWALAVPRIAVRTSSVGTVRNMRLRFHANPFGYSPTDVDPDSYCGEVLITYIPPDSEMVLDGVDRSATAFIKAYPPIPADQNVLSTDGGPVNWPELTCGVPYVLSVDYLYTDTASPGSTAAISVELTRKD